MKNLATILFVLISTCAFAQDKAMTGTAGADTKINWMTWEEAYEANKKEPRKIFIDVYTDWCGWCKKMDKSTFIDASVVKELNENFYAVKFDAEMKKDIDFNGATFSFAGSGRRGSHQLAFALLDGRMSYPSFVLLDENFGRIMLAPGYKTPEQLVPQLTYTSSEAYKKQNFDAYAK